MLSIHQYEAFFLLSWHILNITCAIKKISEEIKELRDFMNENYCRRIGISKENSNYSLEDQNKKDLL